MSHSIEIYPESDSKSGYQAHKVTGPKSSAHHLHKKCFKTGFQAKQKFHM